METILVRIDVSPFDEGEYRLLAQLMVAHGFTALSTFRLATRAFRLPRCSFVGPSRESPAEIASSIKSAAERQFPCHRIRVVAGYLEQVCRTAAGSAATLQRIA